VRFRRGRVVDDDALATQSGRALGTPAFMSPEQALGARRSTSAPMSTSLGATLYQMATGVPPIAARPRR
jgi:serine/threonine protein kinase